MSELKPCPFCGCDMYWAETEEWAEPGEPGIVFTEARGDHRAPCPFVLESPMTFDDINPEGTRRSIAEATIAWNTRADRTARAAELTEQLREAVALLNRYCERNEGAAWQCDCAVCKATRIYLDKLDTHRAAHAAGGKDERH